MVLLHPSTLHPHQTLLNGASPHPQHAASPAQPHHERRAVTPRAPSVAHSHNATSVHPNVGIPPRAATRSTLHVASRQVPDLDLTVPTELKRSMKMKKRRAVAISPDKGCQGLRQFCMKGQRQCGVVRSQEKP